MQYWRLNQGFLMLHSGPQNGFYFCFLKIFLKTTVSSLALTNIYCTQSQRTKSRQPSTSLMENTQSTMLTEHSETYLKAPLSSIYFSTGISHFQNNLPFPGEMRHTCFPSTWESRGRMISNPRPARVSQQDPVLKYI